MRLLADTHIALWAVAEPERMPPRARALVADSSNTVPVSIISVWEVAIKRSLSRANFGQIALSSE